MKTFTCSLLLCFLAITCNCLAQTSESTTAEKAGLYRNSVFLELAGNAGAMSLNYERLLPLQAPGKMLVLRVGAIAAPEGRRREGFSYEFLVPVEVSLLMGQKAVKFEIGLGQTLHQSGWWWSDGGRGRQFTTSNEVIPVLRIGGRWQKPGKHWFVKVAATPFLAQYYTAIQFPFSPLAGVSVGYNFG